MVRNKKLPSSLDARDTQANVSITPRLVTIKQAAAYCSCSVWAIRDVARRTIRPTLEAKNIKWKGLYAGRRGAATAIIGLTGGNYAAAQELLRHKHMSTTLQFYKKQTQNALGDGLKALGAAADANAGK